MGYLFVLIVCNIVYFYKGNLNEIYNTRVSWFEWWLYTSLITNYAMLKIYWEYLDRYGVWTANLIFSLTNIVVSFTGNIFYFGLDLKKAVAIAIILLVAVWAK